jgi:hypothetical protein
MEVTSDIGTAASPLALPLPEKGLDCALASAGLSPATARSSDKACCLSIGFGMAVEGNEPWEVLACSKGGIRGATGSRVDSGF